MKHLKLPVIVAILVVFSFTIILPVSPASASSLDSLLSSNNNSGSSSGNGILNILLGLLLGKLLGNITSSGSSDTGGGFKSTSPSSSNSSGDAIIATAKKYMGSPYVWGAEGPTEFDCSGFTQYVMKQNGVKIPRTAAEQFASGTPVDKKNLQTGDLVFFTTYKPGASHVGFYIGNGNFIHASSAAKQVTISSLDEAYYTEHYIGARSYLR